MATTIEIAQSATMRSILDVAADIGLAPQDLILRGEHIAKVRLSAVERVAKSKPGKLVLLTAMTATRHGEGKTVTTIGLGQALNRLGTETAITLREPSLGPVFGTKGGAAGGGHAQVLPMEEINLHFTGDIHAVTAANNLICAVLDAHLFRGNALGIDPKRIQFPRCTDMNERSLRHIVIGLGGPQHGIPREEGFIISVASELMAILGLTSGLRDLKERLARIIIAFNQKQKPVTVGDLGVQGAATILMKDALMPNLVQTTEGTPAFVHGGPFANIAHGHNTILADRLALGSAEVVVTEAGFGADLGAEKFVDLVCRQSELIPDAGVIAASVRALKHHGGAKKKELEIEDLKRLEAGYPNLDAHIGIVRKLGLTPVIAVNCFPADTDREIDAVVGHCQDQGVRTAPHTAFLEGGKGAEELATMVLDAANHSAHRVRYMYRDDDAFQEKVAKVATEIYGAADVRYESAALEDLERLQDAGLDGLPICIAKTQLSLSDDETLRGAPTGWTLKVREVRASAGAGFLVVIAGDMMRMPGLGAQPAALQMDIDELGRIQGLF